MEMSPCGDSGCFFVFVQFTCAKGHEGKIILHDGPNAATLRNQHPYDFKRLTQILNQELHTVKTANDIRTLETMLRMHYNG